jgi:hypothetical protein
MRFTEDDHPVTTDLRPLQLDALVQADRVNGRVYSDPDVFAAELEHIFTRGWVFVGHTSEIPQPGDYVTGGWGLIRSSWCRIALARYTYWPTAARTVA